MGNPSTSGQGSWNVYVYEFNNPPIAQITSVSIVTLGDLATFDGSGSIDSDGNIVSYQWDFGDGTTGTGVTANHVYISAGIFHVKLTITDNAGASASSEIAILVNTPPVSQIEPIATVILGEPTLFDGSGSYDPDGTIVAYIWSFGDGTNGMGNIATHVYTEASAYAVTLSVIDNHGAIRSVIATTIVQTYAQIIGDLIAIVKAMNLRQGIENSLDVKLKAAISALEAAGVGSNEYAVSKLQDFINEVNAQSGKKLTVEQANQLITAANRIIAAIQ